MEILGRKPFFFGLHFRIREKSQEFWDDNENLWKFWDEHLFFNFSCPRALPKFISAPPPPSHANLAPGLVPSRLPYHLRTAYRYNFTTCIRAATRRGKRRWLLSKYIFRPPKLPSMPTQTPPAVSRWWLFVTGNKQKTQKKVGQFGVIILFVLFFWDQQRTWRKVDQPKSFGPRRKKFCLL